MKKKPERKKEKQLAILPHTQEHKYNTFKPRLVVVIARRSSKKKAITNLCFFISDLYFTTPRPSKKWENHRRQSIQ